MQVMRAIRPLLLAPIAFALVISSNSIAFANETALAAPFIETVKPGASQVELSWSSVSGATGYEVQTYRHLKYRVVLVAGKACTTSSRTCVVKGLVNGGKYQFVLVSLGQSARSLPALSGIVTPRTRATAPRAVKVKVRRSGAAILSWKAPLSNGGTPVRAYKFFATHRGETYEVLCLRVSGSVVRKRSCAPQVAGGYFRFSVRAVTAAGFGASSKKSNRVYLPVAAA